MGRFPQPLGEKGSLRWIQLLVNDHPHLLSQSIGLDSVDWCSPLADDEYAEYRDEAFLDRLGISLPEKQLHDFWPPMGPQWDALGCSAAGEIVLVEAKAHVKELLSPPMKATGLSAGRISSSLSDAACALGATPGTDWGQRFYQYANRLAHAWFLAEVNSVPVRLAFVYIIGDADMHGPTSRREWEAALTVLHEALGLRGRMPRFVTEAFIDIKSLSTTGA